METLENTNGAVKKLTYGDRGHAPMPPGYAPARCASHYTVHSKWLWSVAVCAVCCCCSYHDVKHKNLLNSMWLLSITFLSVGYGDIVPNTYCGRSIAVCTGVIVRAQFCLSS